MNAIDHQSQVRCVYYHLFNVVHMCARACSIDLFGTIVIELKDTQTCVLHTLDDARTAGDTLRVVGELLFNIFCSFQLCVILILKKPNLGGLLNWEAPPYLYLSKHPPHSTAPQDEHTKMCGATPIASQPQVRWLCYTMRTLSRAAGPARP